MAIGYHEHMRHLEIADDLELKVERLLEAFEIDPNRKNRTRLEKAVQELEDFDDQMNKLYMESNQDEKAA